MYLVGTYLCIVHNIAFSYAKHQENIIITYLILVYLLWAETITQKLSEQQIIVPNNLRFKTRRKKIKIMTNDEKKK
jgi:hypothetical protein